MTCGGGRAGWGGRAVPEPPLRGKEGMGEGGMGPRIREDNGWGKGMDSRICGNDGWGG